MKMKARAKVPSILMAAILVVMLCPVAAFAGSLTGSPSSFYGNSGFSYRGYTHLSYNSNWANGYQYTACTSTSAPIGNVRSRVFVCSSQGQELAVGGWAVNNTTLSKGSPVSAVAYYTNYGSSSFPVYALGYSSCWKSGGWYDILTQKTGSATVSSGRSMSKSYIPLVGATGVETNESNQLLGTVFDIEQGFLVELVKVKATNGNDGYVYYAEQEAIMSQGMDTPELAIETANENRTKAESAFRGSLSRNLSSSCYGKEGSVLVDYSDAKAILDIYYACMADGETLENDELLEGVLAGISENQDLSVLEVDVEVLKNSLFETNDAVATHIPVYDKDGRTVVGEFAVGGL